MATFLSRAFEGKPNLDPEVKNRDSIFRPQHGP
jgi:hypothetical protein